MNPCTNVTGFPTYVNEARYSVLRVIGAATARQPLDAASNTAHAAALAHAQTSSSHHFIRRTNGAAITTAIPNAAAGHSGLSSIRCRRVPKNGAAVPS